MSLPEIFDEVLGEGLTALDVAVDAAGRARLAAYVQRLLFWNRKVNLTAVTAPAEVAEVHLVDCIALLRTLGPAKTLLDIGSGNGLPGVALACARKELRVTCCDRAQKKVAFVKAVAAELDLDVRAKAVRAAGDPGGEGLPRCDAVVSRALTDVERWLPLGLRYLSEGGRLFAMLGREAEDATLLALAGENGLVLEVVDRFVLPRSGAQRAVACFRLSGPELTSFPSS